MIVGWRFFNTTCDFHHDLSHKEAYFRNSLSCATRPACGRLCLPLRLKHVRSALSSVAVRKCYISRSKRNLACPAFVDAGVHVES